MAAVCLYCGSLDNTEMFWDESRHLAWLSEDIAALYKENSNFIERIKKINLELEEFSATENYETNLDYDEEDIIEDLEEKNAWLLKEDKLRGQLVLQVQTLQKDLATLYQQHQQEPELPHHLWGHHTQWWRPPSSLPTAKSRKKPGKLVRWIQTRMPVLLIDLL